MDPIVLNGFLTPRPYINNVNPGSEINFPPDFDAMPLKPVKPKRTSSRLYSLYLADVAKKLDFDEFGNVDDNNIN